MGRIPPLIDLVAAPIGDTAVEMGLSGGWFEVIGIIDVIWVGTSLAIKKTVAAMAPTAQAPMLWANLLLPGHLDGAYASQKRFRILHHGRKILPPSENGFKRRSELGLRSGGEPTSVQRPEGASRPTRSASGSTCQGERLIVCGAIQTAICLQSRRSPHPNC